MMPLRWVLYVLHQIVFRIYGIVLFFGKPGAQTILPWAALAYGIFYVRPEVHTRFDYYLLHFPLLSYVWAYLPSGSPGIAIDVGMFLGWLLARWIFIQCSRLLGTVLGAFPLVLRPLPPTARLQATSDEVQTVVVTLAVLPLPEPGIVPVYPEDDFSEAAPARSRLLHFLSTSIERWLPVAAKLSIVMVLAAIIKTGLEISFPVLLYWGVAVYAAQASIIAVLWCYPRTLTILGVIFGALVSLGVAVELLMGPKPGFAVQFLVSAVCILLVGLALWRLFPALLTVRTMAGVILAPLAIGLSLNPGQVFPILTYGGPPRAPAVADLTPQEQPISPGVALPPLTNLDAPLQQAARNSPPAEPPCLPVQVASPNAQGLRHVW